MKVPTLYLQIFYLAIDKDGNQHEVWTNSEIGCRETCRLLEKYYGIQTVPSTVFNGKKIFTPTKFLGNKEKIDTLAYLNWSLNRTNRESKFFDNDPEKRKYYKNNPIVDVKLIVRKKSN